MAIEIVVTGSYNDKDIKRAMRDMEKMSEQAGGASKSISDKFAGLADGMERVGTRMTAAVTLPIVAAGAAAFAAFAEEEAAIAKMESVIKSTGGVAGVTSEHITKLASSLQKTTTFADDATIGAAALVLTFKNLRNQAGAGNDVFDRTIKASQDMATVMGTDLNSATMMISKALNEPAEGLSKLSRAGVQFTAEQENMIKTMVASGDTLGAQKVMLGELESQFGGAAEAVGKTSSGQLKQAMNDLGDSAEAVGGIIAPVINKISGFLKGLADRFNSLSPQQKEFVVGALAIAAAIGPVLIIGSKLISGFLALKNVIMVVKGAMVGLNAVMLANPIVLIVVGIVALIAILVIAYNKVEGFRNLVDAAFQAIGKVAMWLYNNVFKPAFDAIGKVVKMVWENILKPAFKEIAKFFVEEIQPRLEKLRAKFNEVWPYIQAAVAKAWEKMQPILEKVTKFIGEVLVQHLKNMFAIWKTVFAVISTVVSVAWTILEPIFKFIVGIIIDYVIPYVKMLWTVWSAIFAAIGEVISFVWNSIIKPVWDIIVAVIQNVLVPIFMTLWGIVQVVWGFIAQAISFAWNNIIKPIWDIIVSVITTVLVPIFNFLLGVARSVWDGISSAISRAWGFIAGVFESIKGGLGNVRDFFSEQGERIKGVFSGIADAIGSAFRGAFDAVKRAWNNTLGGKGFRAPDWLPEIGGREFRIPSFAKGGVVPGIPGTPVPAIVHAGEMILRRQQVDQFRPGMSGSSSTYHISVNVEPGANPTDTGRAIVDALKAYERSNGASWRGAA